VLSGCNAVTTAIEHRNLAVENKMTDSVFLDPVSPHQQTIYLQVRNTTDRQDFDIDSDLKQAIQAKGYSIVSDQARAHYILQVNVLQVGKMEKSTIEQLFAKGFGTANVIGATAYGAGVGAMAGGLNGLGYGALIAAPVALVADAFVKAETFAAITDVQISERSSTRVTDRMNQSLKQGRSGTRNVNSELTTDQKVNRES
jgi:Enterobacterial TraT complement resistance protein